MRALVLLKQLVRLLIGLIVLVIVAGAVLYVLGQNESPKVAKFVVDRGADLVSPFANVFEFKDNKLEIAARFGLGAVAWLILGAIIGKVLKELIRVLAGRRKGRDDRARLEREDREAAQTRERARVQQDEERARAREGERERQGAGTDEAAGAGVAPAHEAPAGEAPAGDAVTRVHDDRPQPAPRKRAE